MKTLVLVVIIGLILYYVFAIVTHFTRSSKPKEDQNAYTGKKIELTPNPPFTFTPIRVTDDMIGSSKQLTKKDEKINKKHPQKISSEIDNKASFQETKEIPFPSFRGLNNNENSILPNNLISKF